MPSNRCYLQLAQGLAASVFAAAQTPNVICSTQHESAGLIARTDELPSDESRSANPFAGAWNGTYELGYLAMAVSPTGVIDGRYEHFDGGASGWFVGHIGADGRMNLVGFNDEGIENGQTICGFALMDGEDHFGAEMGLHADGCVGAF